MPGILASSITGLALFLAASAWAGDDTALLQTGTYEVQVSLDLPNVEDTGAKKTATVCVSGPEGNDNRGLVVLSENNPLKSCPASNFHQVGDTLAFDITCPGGNAAIASAKYVLGPQTFQGRISMKMGGKNMTMTETQIGRRIGDCAPSSPPHS